MVEACLKQCTKVFSVLLEAGVLQSFRFEYDTYCVEPSTECSASLGSALDELIRRFQEYKINDRIEAFITRKRKEVDEWNVQEFCCSKASEVDTDAVSRVVNQWGPMTKLMRPTTSHTQSPVKQEHSATIPEGIEERLRNMESHLKLKSGCAVPHDVYARLKQLEDRILYLEGISPDYFSVTAHSAPSAQASQSGDTSRQYEDWSMSQIESRINLLQSRLREKAEAASEPSTSSMAL
ncbi:MAP3K12-binding inhibitory protein 1-like isoform X4 [Dermacentor silvarum]|uniref:MAP3K12-binding inhibitory protein 1-like isoform X4 n=1 Tax=Dermacentor silvarum TaxID=543639 RepID=UPI002100C5E2|nr:MAP3K12-binding inhibitory protein 1-like isoform X4 [Dermacentor silvarum]